MRRKLMPLALGGLGIGSTEFVMMGILPDVANDFNITIPQAGHMISGYALGVVIGAPLLVAISSKMAPKKILFGLMALFTVFNTLSAFASNESILFFSRIMSGLPHGAFFGVGAVVASRIADLGKQARAISIMFSGLTIANLLTVPLGTFIGHEYSWRYTFAGIGVIGLVTMVSIYLILPSLPANKNSDIKKEIKVFQRVEPWLIFMITAIGTGGLFSWISYIAPMMTEVTRFSASSVPYIMMVAGLGMVVGNFAGGKLADSLKPLNATFVLLIGMAVTLVLIFFFSTNPIMSLIMTFFAGACSMAIASPIQLLMIESSKGAEMLGASITQAAFNVGNALGAFLGGLPIAAGWGYTSPSAVGVLMALGGAAFAWVLIRRHTPLSSRSKMTSLT